MGFTIVQGSSPMVIWQPVVKGDICYTGQIVYANNEGVSTIGAAAGASNTTNKRVPFGVVLGNNLYEQTFDTTNKANLITEASPFESTTRFTGTEGVWAKGDRQSMVQIAVITPSTVLVGPLYNAALGTAPTLLTVTTGSTTGVQATTNASEATGVANLGTVYFRSGANAGAYRITTDTDDGTTAVTWDSPTPQAVAVGDTAVRVNLRTGGTSRCQLDAEALYIPSEAALTTHYYTINVLKLDLSVATKEHVYFTFDGDNFSSARA